MVLPREFAMILKFVLRRGKAGGGKRVLDKRAINASLQKFLKA